FSTAASGVWLILSMSVRYSVRMAQGSCPRRAARDHRFEAAPVAGLAHHCPVVPARQRRRNFSPLGRAIAVDHVLLNGVHGLSVGPSRRRPPAD
ncbi:hypothetical protein, partial [Streptomyces sp. NPDC005989]|uniref:hypothetical protein n=1 Tax=Streptomyces sp. NPDC005989 TaxID=3156727 RepID=UPI00340DB6CE